MLSFTRVSNRLSVFLYVEIFGNFVLLEENGYPFVRRVLEEHAYWRKVGSCLRFCITSSFLASPPPSSSSDITLPPALGHACAVFNTHTFVTPLSELLVPATKNYPHYQLLLCVFQGSFAWLPCHKWSNLVVVKMLKHNFMLQWGMFSHNSVG